MSFAFAAGTDVGVKRRDRPNEDSIGVFKSGVFKQLPALLVVADGMGGYKGGAKASALVVKAFQQQFKRGVRSGEGQAFLQKCVLSAHADIQKFSKKPVYEKMGSTMVAALIDGDTAYVANVGDCRAYVISQGSMKQISRDQSVVAALVENGHITRDEARNHPRRNHVSMSISAKRPTIAVNYSSTPLEQADAVVLCSDGVWAAITEEQICSIVSKLKPKQAVEKIIDLVNTAQGPDNLSIIIASQQGSVLKQNIEDTQPGY